LYSAGRTTTIAPDENETRLGASAGTAGVAAGAAEGAEVAEAEDEAAGFDADADSFREHAAGGIRARPTRIQADRGPRARVRVIVSVLSMSEESGGS
jgi:hypothetical protein